MCTGKAPLRTMASRQITTAMHHHPHSVVTFSGRWFTREELSFFQEVGGMILCQESTLGSQGE